MDKFEKYKGVIPAFYACYDDEGNISPERIHKLAKHYLEVGVKGLYVGGSSGECIYHTVEERKLVLEEVMKAVGGKMTIIAHVAAASTDQSIELAKHAETLGVDALAAIPPIYFRLPEHAIEGYWNDIMDATDLDFIVYNIPGTTGYALTPTLLKKLVHNEKVIGVKNSSMPIQDIYLFKHNSRAEFIVFNGPDEQFVGGRVMGADGGIGGTYGAMPELFLAADHAIRQNNIELAREIQYRINDIIFSFFECEGNMYDVIKLILAKRDLNIGRARKPLQSATEADKAKIDAIAANIEDAVNKYKSVYQEA
ncbi:dihydrodipicolinate synthase family protein [Fundicoccus sp. Sow4_H7]|uniref:dihydrodipicolinate synthase family protein n=1 Tax=Fundicoccus sp. Sow4_H7 TaxID=3438784 RepID=UPI003F92AF5D